MTKVEKLKREVLNARAACDDCYEQKICAHSDWLRSSGEQRLARENAYDAAIHRIHRAQQAVRDLEAALLEAVLEEPIKP